MNIIGEHTGKARGTNCFAAIIRNESFFEAQAESSAGTRGLMQLMPDTAEWIAHKLGIEDFSFDSMFDPDTNIRFGCWYLGYLSALFNNDTVCIVSAFYAGQSEVSSWLADPLKSDDGKTVSVEKLPEGPIKIYVKRILRDIPVYQEYYFVVGEQSKEIAEPTQTPKVYGKTVLYYNPTGGAYYHLDRNCKRIAEKYLPLQGHFTYDELNDEEYRYLKPCAICGAPYRE